MCALLRDLSLNLFSPSSLPSSSSSGSSSQKLQRIPSFHNHCLPKLPPGHRGLLPISSSRGFAPWNASISTLNSPSSPGIREKRRLYTSRASIESSPSSSSSPLPSRSRSLDQRLEYDVIIVGAGVIGLSIAHKILSETSLSVALVDAARPCSGATGAGQGYIWLGHKSPSLASWQLSRRSNFLWNEFAEKLQDLDLDPEVIIGYKRTGSLLFGTTPEHAISLQKRAETLYAEGVKTEFLNSDALRETEPQLNVGVYGSAVLTPDDCQIDAHLAAAYFASENRKYCSSGRFEEIFYDPVTDFLWSDQYHNLAGVQTTNRAIYCRERVIMAAGAWSGDVMKKAFEKLCLPYVLATKPRKGHLLVFEGLGQISLKHGLMEFAYEKLADSSDVFGIASTATIDSEGRLLLGSSRQFAGFDFSLQYDVMEAILKKAGEYLPVLADVHLAEALKAGTVRIGHRPYVPDGRPLIGEIQGLGRLLLATGHEGEGLALSLGTAEMVVNLVLQKQQSVDPTPFSPEGRLGVPPAQVSVSH